MPLFFARPTQAVHGWPWERCDGVRNIWRRPHGDEAAHLGDTTSQDGLSAQHGRLGSRLAGTRSTETTGGHDSVFSLEETADLGLSRGSGRAVAAHGAGYRLGSLGWHR